MWPLTSMCLWQNAITADFEENTIKVLGLPGCSSRIFILYNFLVTLTTALVSAYFLSNFDENLSMAFSAVIAFCQRRIVV